MFMKPLTAILLLTCLMSMVISTPLVSSNQLRPDGNNTVNMFYLGNINGKSYYTENSAKNWPSAKNFCISSGMHLASITTVQEVAFLQSVHNCTSGPSYFCQPQWIGGRTLISDISQFQWDYNNQTVTNPGIPYEAPDATNVCLAYDANVETGGKFITAACTTSYRQLCEIVQGA